MGGNLKEQVCLSGATSKTMSLRCDNCLSIRPPEGFEMVSPTYDHNCKELDSLQCYQLCPDLTKNNLITMLKTLWYKGKYYEYDV